MKIGNCFILNVLLPINCWAIIKPQLWETIPASAVKGLEMENFIFRSPSLSQSTRDFCLQRIYFGSRHSLEYFRTSASSLSFARLGLDALPISTCQACNLVRAFFLNIKKFPRFHLLNSGAVLSRFRESLGLEGIGEWLCQAFLTTSTRVP